MRIKVEKKYCSTCPAHNRHVRLVAFFKKNLYLCEECARVARNIAEKEEQLKQAEKAATVRVSTPRIPLRPTTKCLTT